MFGSWLGISICVLFQVVGGELGGNTVVKFLTGSVCLMLWATYIVVASLKAYDIIKIGGSDTDTG